MFLPPVKNSVPLTLRDLKQRIQTHNTTQTLFGIVLIPSSIFLWLLSFVVLFTLFSAPLRVLGLPIWLAAYPAMLGIALLVFEGVRGGWQLFEAREVTTLKALRDSPFSEMHNAGLLGWRIQGAVAFAGIVSEVLFCAPRSAVMAIQAFRSLLNVDDRLLQQAVDIRQILFEKGTWQPLMPFQDREHALVLLQRLQLIDIDDREGYVKLPS